MPSRPLIGCGADLQPRLAAFSGAFPFGFLILDGVKFSRQLDAGSTTVYAVEFKRLDGRYVTAFWAARGDVVFDVVSPTGRGELTAMYGSTATLNGQSFQVASGTSPVYLVTDKPLTSVKIACRSFPKGEVIARSGNEVKIESADQVDVRPDPTIESTHTNFLPILKSADFTVTSAVDEEVGKCIEVVLDANDKYKSKYVTEYTTVRFRETSLTSRSLHRHCASQQSAQRAPAFPGAQVR